MTAASDWNTRVIEEFRANEGRVGGPYEGGSLTLLHYRGLKSGREFVAPVRFMRDEQDATTIYVFASNAGGPSHPDWYHNLTAAGHGQVEVGTELYDVTVHELHGHERDLIYAEQARRYPAFADYAEKAAGIRTIPVLALRRQ